MPKGISLSVAADTKAFSQGIASGVIKPLDDTDKALQDVSTQSETTGTALVEQMERAQKATKDNAVAITENNQKIVADSKRSYAQDTANLELSTREQTRLKREALKTGAAQAVLSVSDFSGSATELAESAGSAVIGIASTMPGLGLAIGAAGAVGLGIVQAATAKADEEAKEFKQDVSDITSELIKSGTAGKVALGDISDALQKLATETDPAKTDLAEIYDAAHESGTSYKDLAQAYSGATDKLKELAETGKQKYQDDQKYARAAQVQSQKDADASIAQQHADFAVRNELVKTTEAQKQSNTYVDEAAKKATAAAKAYKLWVDAGGPQMQELADRTKELDGEFVAVASDADTFITKQGKFDATKFVKTMEAEQKALANYNDELNNSGLSTSAKEYLDTLPQKQAAAYLAGYQSASPALKAKLAKEFTALGKSVNGEYNKAFSDKPIDAPKVKTPVVSKSQIESFRNDLQRQINAKPITITVKAKAKYLP